MTPTAKQQIQLPTSLVVLLVRIFCWLASIAVVTWEENTKSRSHIRDRLHLDSRIEHFAQALDDRQADPFARLAVQ